jgi:Rhomboid family
MHSGKLLGLATGPKVCRAKPPLQRQQSYAGQVLDSPGRPFCPRKFVSPSRQHDFSIRLGGTLQNSIGSGRYLAVFLTGGFAGFVFSLPFMPPSAGMVGASAEIFSVAACVMLVRPLKFSWLFLAPQGLVAIIYFLYNVLVVYDPRLIVGYDRR